jgi:hypothetical protein
MDTLKLQDKLTEFMYERKIIYEDLSSQTKNNHWNAIHNFIFETKYQLKSFFKLDEKEADKIMLKYFNNN